MNSNIHNKKSSSVTIASWSCMQPYIPLRLPLRYLLQSCLILCLGLLWFTESMADPKEPLCLEEGGFHHCVDAKRDWSVPGVSRSPDYHPWYCTNAWSRLRKADNDNLTYLQKLALYKEYFRSCEEEVHAQYDMQDYLIVRTCSEAKESEAGWVYYEDSRYRNRGIPSLQYKDFEYKRKAFYPQARASGEDSPCGDTDYIRPARLYRSLIFSCAQDGYSLHRTRPICYRLIELEDEDPLSCKPHSPNPVSMQTGEKRLFEEDYAGTAFGGLRFSRSYRANGHLGVSGEEVDLSLGANWQHNYSMRLYPSTSKAGMHLRQGEGGGLMSFNQSGKVPYETGGRSNQQLKKRGTGWRYERGDGYYEDYDSSGRLLRRHYKDARGTETLAYSGDRLASVTDSSGRKLILSYDAKGRLIKLVHPGGEVRYTHGEKNLMMVENADGSRRQYHYELSNMPGKLTGYSDRGVGERKWVRRGRYKYKDFAEDGGVQVLSTEHEGAGDKLVFDYSNYGSGLRYSSYRVNKNWKEEFLFTDGEAYPQRLYDQGGRSPRTYYHMENGQLSSVEITGRGYAIYRDNYEYDESTGLEVVREEGYSGDVYRRISTRWSDRWVLPVEIVQGERKRDSERVTELLRESYRYDDSGRLLAYSEQDVGSGKKREMRYGYEQGGRLLWEDGYREDVTDISRYEYDERGHRTKYTNALGQVTRYTGHDVHGNVTEERDANGLLTSYQYDKRSRLVGMRMGDWETRYERDQDGRVTRLTLADGSVLAYRYNTGGKLVELQDSEGNRINYKRDAFDNVLEERWYDSEGEERRRFDRGYGYDDDEGEMWERDGANRWVQERTWISYWWLDDGWFEEGEDEQEIENVNWWNREERSWNYLNQLIEIEDVHGGETELEYDVLNNVNLVNDPIEKKTEYGTNAFGDRIWEENVATGRTSYAVDHAGNRTRMQSADGRVTSYSYDALGRLLRKDDTGEETDVSYMWDTCHIGSLCGVTDGGGKWEYNYTVHGLESRRSYQPAGVNWQLETSRNWHQGRLIGETLPSGRVLKYRYHKNGQLRKIVSQRGEYRKILLGHISWLPFGDVQGYRHNNGVSEVWKYDKSYRLLEQKSELHHFEYEWTQYGGGMLNSQQYAYTLADGVHRGGGEYEYHGGNRGRLWTEEIQRGEDYAAYYYRYDANGNRSDIRVYPLTGEKVSERGPWSWDEKELSYNDRAQLVGVGRNEVGYQYDAVGRRSALLAYTEEGNEYTKYKYEYGSDRRLRRIVEPVQAETEGEEEVAPAADRVVAEYEYDHRGLRVKKTIGKQVRYFNYDDQGRLWSEHRPDGTVVREYVWLGYRPVHMVSYSKEGRVRGRYAIHVDHLGTPRMLTNRESRIVWLWESDAFGNGAANEDVDGDGRTVKFPLRFPGQYYDKETGLHYNWHRYYDPTIGRYITSDPRGILVDFSDPQRMITARMMGIPTTSEDNNFNLNHLYGYADQNPLMFADPTGEIPWWVLPAAIGGYLTYKWAMSLYECVQTCENTEGECEGDTRNDTSCRWGCALKHIGKSPKKSRKNLERRR